jgi:hypothetical protein
LSLSGMIGADTPMAGMASRTGAGICLQARGARSRGAAGLRAPFAANLPGAFGFGSTRSSCDRPSSCATLDGRQTISAREPMTSARPTSASAAAVRRRRRGVVERVGLVLTGYFCERRRSGVKVAAPARTMSKMPAASASVIENDDVAWVAMPPKPA